MPVAIVIAALVVGSILFHLLSPWWQTPLASNWGSIDSALDITLWICAAAFILLNLFMAYAVMRYHHRPGHKAEYEPENARLEKQLTFWTGIGIIGMLAPGLAAWNEYVNVPKDAAIVEAVGQQWQWTFRFPGPDGVLGGAAVKHMSADNTLGVDPRDPFGRDDILIETNELHLPLGKPVKMVLRSKDVLHDFYVPEFRAKMDLVPGIVTYFWMTPTVKGKYDILCAELCGVGHHEMRGTVIVESPGEFDAWLAQQISFGEVMAQANRVSCLPLPQLRQRRSPQHAGSREESLMATTLADDFKPLYHPKTWIGKYVWSQDHKVIAIQYSITAIGIGVVALVLSVLMRLQLGFPGTFSWIQPENYLQYVSMHGMIMVVYLLTALLLGGFGNYLIPLMVGARDMVFPFVNMLSYWVYLLSVIVLVSGFFLPGGPTGAGWTLYPPQAITGGTPGLPWGIATMLVSLAIFIIAFTMGGLNYVTTVLQARCKGMTLMRMPLSVWGIFTASIMGLLAFPALFVAAIMMLLDLLAGTSFFMPTIQSMGQTTATEGGNPILFQHLFWFFGHPEVYIVALPAFGMVSDLISVHARRNIFGYRMMVWAIVIIGALSFVVWAHHMYVSGMNPYFGFFFAISTLIIAIPTAIKVYNWLLTLWRGDIHLRVPMLFAIAFIFTFIHGGLTGLFLGNVSVDVPLSDTMFVVGHFHMVMGVSPILVIFGAIYHWYPKITGRMWNDTLGKLHFWITFLGVYGIYLPMHYIGILGVPRRYYALGETGFIPDSAHWASQATTIAALLVFVAQGLFFYNMIWSYFRGPKADANPWGAASLEWQTPETPPRHGNWGAKLPIVYRWAYDYSVPGAPRDFIAQNEPPS